MSSSSSSSSSNMSSSSSSSSMEEEVSPVNKPIFAAIASLVNRTISSYKPFFSFAASKLFSRPWPNCSPLNEYHEPFFSITPVDSATLAQLFAFERIPRTFLFNNASGFRDVKNAPFAGNTLAEQHIKLGYFIRRRHFVLGYFYFHSRSELVQEQNCRVRFCRVHVNLPQRLRHQPRMRADLDHTNLAFNFRSRYQRGDGIHANQIHRGGSD